MRRVPSAALHGWSSQPWHSLWVGVVVRALALLGSVAWLGGCDYPTLKKRVDVQEKEIADLRSINAALSHQLTNSRADVLRLEAELERRGGGLSPTPGRPTALEPVRAALVRLLSGSGATVAVRGARVAITMPSAFQSGKAALTPAGQQLLRRIASAIKAHCSGWQVGVAGHTDSTPIGRAGRLYPTNWHLSGFRALAAMDYLNRSCGIPAKTLHFRGYGQHHPLGSNATAAGRARNRRIEIILAPPSR